MPTINNAMISAHGIGRFRPDPSSQNAGSPNGIYPVKNAAVPSYAGNMTATQIMQVLDVLPAGELAQAGRLYTKLSDTLETLAGQVAVNAADLVDSWTGQSAQTAMGRFQQLYDQATTLAAQAHQVGSVYTWLGTEVLPAFTGLPNPNTTFGADTPEANAVAQSYLTALTEHIITANNNLPNQIGSTPTAHIFNLGPVAPGAKSSASAGVASGSGAGGTLAANAGSGHRRTSLSAASATVRPAGGSSGGTRTASTGAPGGGPPIPGSLQSAPVPGGPMTGTQAGATTASGGGAGVGLVPGAPFVPGTPLPGSGSAASGAASSASDEYGALPGPEVPAITGYGGIGTGAADGSYNAPAVARYGVGSPQYGTTSSEYGASAVASSEYGVNASEFGAAGAIQTGAVSDNGVTGFPAAGVGGQTEMERRRQTWMSEVDDIWTSPVPCVPPIIEGDKYW
ncbi:MAG TPA: hypothetical protein VF070_47665 [Streptosporangiaceae bacterium]